MTVLRALPVWGAGLLLGAVVPAAVLAGVTLTPGILPFALVVTLGHAIVLGLPVALLCRWREWTHPVAAAAAGFAIGIVPVVFVAWPPDTSGYASTLGESLLLAGGYGLLGAAGACTFWLTLHLCDALTPGAVVSASRGAAAAAVALCAIAGVATLPYLAEDRTCHNMFRDSQADVAPRVNIAVAVEPSDEAKIASVFDRIAARRQLDYRRQNQVFSLCDEQGLLIFGMSIETTLSVNLYYRNQDDAWLEPAREIVDALQTSWPDKLTFLGAGGRAIQPPENLSPKK